jgi:hypothetical protein
MLKDLSRDNPYPGTAKANSTTIPDPWTLPSPTSEEKLMESWQLPQEVHPLISPVGKADTLQLPSTTATPGQMLLQDWLKLKAEQAKQLAHQLQEAIGLLYWMEEVA